MCTGPIVPFMNCTTLLNSSFAQNTSYAPLSCYIFNNRTQSAVASLAECGAMRTDTVKQRYRLARITNAALYTYTQTMLLQSGVCWNTHAHAHTHHYTDCNCICRSILGGNTYEFLRYAISGYPRHYWLQFESIVAIVVRATGCPDLLQPYLWIQLRTHFKQ
jgi:hypothetical protein